MTTAVLADDHDIVRQGLRTLLTDRAGLCLLGETGDGLQVVPLLREHQPDILILDLSMPGLSGLDILPEASKASPFTRVVVYSMHSGEPYVVEALRNGALSFVLKSDPIDELLQAIESAGDNRRYLSTSLPERAVEAYFKATEGDDGDVHQTLTQRQREVLHLAADGLTNADIAERLGIGIRTVETHRTHLMVKLGLHGQADLIRYALERDPSQ